jgi:hypothetical protein
MAVDLEWDGRINDRDRDPYVALGAENEILKFDAAGLSSIFADASDGGRLPVSIARCRR